MMHQWWYVFGCEYLSRAASCWLTNLQAGGNLLSLCASLAVTPGLILMLNYFSFANDVAWLQSAFSEYAWGCEERTGFMEMRIHFCRFHSHRFLLSTYRPCVSVFATGWVHLCECLCTYTVGVEQPFISLALIQWLCLLMQSKRSSPYNSTSLICKTCFSLHLASRHTPLISNSHLVLICLPFKCNRKPHIQGSGLFCLPW